MKKQAKSKKVRSVKSVAPKQVVIVHSRRQKILGVIALAGLFLCGLFVGMAMNNNHAVKPIVAQPVQEAEDFVEIEQHGDVCGEIERLIARRLPNASDNADARIERAKVYASLAERGCPENSAAYVELARQELDIARAIENDEFGRDETIEVVETYKRLHMQAAAEEIFEKAKKLTDPAIDFIIQVEKIINE